MSPHLIILTSAMSLGGMASVGFTHFGAVEAQIQNYSEEQAKIELLVEEQELGEQIAAGLAELEGSLSERIDRDSARIEEQLAVTKSQVEWMQSKAESLEILLSRQAEELMAMEFTLETHSKSFVPLRAIQSRFEPVNASERAHPLLPPVDNWTSQY